MVDKRLNGSVPNTVEEFVGQLSTRKCVEDVRSASNASFWRLGGPPSSPSQSHWLPSRSVHFKQDSKTENGAA